MSRFRHRLSLTPAKGATIIGERPDCRRREQNVLNDKIRIGTLVDGVKKPEKYIAAILPYGFESFSLMFWGDKATRDLKGTAARIQAVLEDGNAVISSLTIYDNPSATGETGKTCRAIWRKLIDATPFFGCDVVAGYAGGEPGKSMPDCMKKFGRNIAICPEAWDLMFNAVPLENVGLEWEPCHQMVQLIDPMP